MERQLSIRQGQDLALLDNALRQKMADPVGSGASLQRIPRFIAINLLSFGKWEEVIPLRGLGVNKRRFLVQVGLADDPHVAAGFIGDEVLPEQPGGKAVPYIKINGGIRCQDRL